MAEQDGEGCHITAIKVSHTVQYQMHLILRIDQMKMNKLTKLIVASAVSLAFAGQAQANRDTVQVAGSSTVLPFASIAAEEFGNNFAQFRTPVVGSGGTTI